MTQVLEPHATQATTPLVGGARPPGLAADRAFRWVAYVAGALVLAVLGLIVYATLKNSWDWFSSEGLGIFGTTWAPSQGDYGAGGLMLMTLMVGAIALLISVPVSIGIALFVTEVAPRRARLPIIFVIDLLAAIPSVVFGLWALKQLSAPLADLYQSLHDVVSGIPVLDRVFGAPSASGLAIMTGGIVVAIMITPIVTAITREVFATCPQAQKEASLAMGATQWETIRGAVFPHARSGVVAAVIIGFGRAVGETIAIFLVIGSSQQLTSNVLGPGDTLASAIVGQFGEAEGIQRSALIGFGVVLLLLTIVLGTIARAVLRRANNRLGVAL